jgi:hypothetical protein
MEVVASIRMRMPLRQVSVFQIQHDQLRDAALLRMRRRRRRRLMTLDAVDRGPRGAGRLVEGVRVVELEVEVPAVLPPHVKRDRARRKKCHVRSRSRRLMRLSL